VVGDDRRALGAVDKVCSGLNGAMIGGVFAAGIKSYIGTISRQGG
jgi:hypothetical protein